MAYKSGVALVVLLSFLAAAPVTPTADTVPQEWLNSAVLFDVGSKLLGRSRAGFRFDTCANGEAFVNFSSAPTAPEEGPYLLLTDGNGSVIANLTHGNVTLPAQQHAVVGPGQLDRSPSSPVQFFAFIRFPAYNHVSSDPPPPQASALYYLTVRDNCCHNHTGCTSKEWSVGTSFCTAQGTCTNCQACSLLDDPIDGQCPEVCSGIRAMDLESKCISIFPSSYSFPPNVVSLNLANNLFQEVPRALGDLLHLKNVDISGNPLDAVLRSLVGRKAGDQIPALTRNLPCSLQAFAVHHTGSPWTCRAKTVIIPANAGDDSDTIDALTCAGPGRLREGDTAHVWTCYLTPAGEQQYADQSRASNDDHEVNPSNDHSASTFTHRTSQQRLIFLTALPISTLVVTVVLALHLNRKKGDNEENRFRIFIAMFLSALAVGLNCGFVAFQLFSNKFHNAYTCSSNGSDSSKGTGSDSSTNCPSWHVVNQSWLNLDVLRNCSVLFCVIAFLLFIHAWWLALSFIFNRRHARAQPSLLPCRQNANGKRGNTNASQAAEQVDRKLLGHLIFIWVLKLIFGEAVQLTVLSVYAAAMYVSGVHSMLTDAHNDVFLYALVATVMSCAVTLCMIVRYCRCLCTTPSPATTENGARCWPCYLRPRRRVHVHDGGGRSSRNLLLRSNSPDALVNEQIPLENNESCDVVVKRMLPDTLDVDAIVCTVRPDGSPRGKLADELWRAAGQSLQECRALWRAHGPLHSGCARITGPDRLEQVGHLKALVQVALWKRTKVCGASATRRAVLRHAVFQALLLAGKRSDVTSIGIPLMGTAKVSPSQAAREAVVALLLAARLKVLGQIRRVVFFDAKAKGLQSFVTVVTTYKFAFAGASLPVTGGAGSLLLPPMTRNGEAVGPEHAHDVPGEPSHVWYWHNPGARDAREEWIPYDWEQQRLLEQAHVKGDRAEVRMSGARNGQPSDSTNIPAGATCASYSVNINSKQQRNTVSGYKRDVKRVERRSGAPLPPLFREAREKARRALEASLSFVSQVRVASHFVNEKTAKLKVFPRDKAHNARLMRHPVFTNQLCQTGCKAQLEQGDVVIKYALHVDFLAMQGLAFGLKDDIMIPETWSRRPTDPARQLDDVCASSSEYRKVANLVRDRGLGSSCCIITRIQRVQNHNLWSQYFHKRAEILENRAGVEGLNELQLFHGTRSTSPNVIIRDNFDPRTSNNDCLYGMASYFAQRSLYAHLYAYSVPGTQSQRQIFLARVAAGKVLNLGTQRQTGLRKPPNGFDSVGALVKDDDYAIMVYGPHQAYPDYLITYRTASTSD